MVNLEIGDKLYTAKDAGMLIYVGDNTADMYLLTVKGNMSLNRQAIPLNAAQLSRWIELKSRDGAIAHMDARQ